MKPIAVLLGIAVSLLLARTAYAADPLGQTATTVQAVPAVATAPATCSSAYDFFATDCPLTWYGVTLYGTIDMGGTWQTHGTPFNDKSPPGVEYLLSKNSNRSGLHRGPNQLTQSNIGIKGNEEFLPGWAFVFDLEAGFDPYSLKFA